MERRAEIIITVEDIQYALGCTYDEAVDIWDEIDEENDIEETLDQAAMEQFNILLSKYNRNSGEEK